MTYKFLSHTSEVKVFVHSKTLKILFLESFEAIKSIMLEDEIQKIKQKKLKTIKITPKEKKLSSLFYNFLEEFIYLLESEYFIASEVVITNLDIHKCTLSAKVKGDKSSYYNISNKIKSPTYENLKIKRDKRDNSWQASFVLDV